MREQLLGYLMAALEPHEVAEVEAQLKANPALARDYDLLRRSLEPLECDGKFCEPPPALAHRTCQFVAQRTRIRVAPEMGGGSRRWSFQDMFVTAGTMAAAAMLFFPAINVSRNQAQIAGCQNQLRQIGLAFMNYSETFPPYFPVAPSHGPEATSGYYAPALVDAGLVNDHATFVCPADPRLRATNFRVPSKKEIAAATGPELDKIQATMGGSFGATMGHLEAGRYAPTKDLGRHCFVLVSDLPSTDLPDHQSQNHGGQGQNTLFEDCHVKFLKTCQCPVDTLGDNVFANQAGQEGPGLHVDDSVITSGPFATQAVSLMSPSK